MSTVKDQQCNDVICRNHSARSERDLYRICPGKLTKHELENLYFALLENNLELKKTIHVQQDKLKVLSTKVQRLTTVQRNAAGKIRDCCACKVLVNEQKELISDLKKSNDSMAEKIRILNMRLCSAKQFLKRSPSQMRCPRCFGNASVSFKNLSMAGLTAKPSDTSVKKTDASCQYTSDSNDALQSPKTKRTVDTESYIPEKDGGEKLSNNKYGSLKDELKQKVLGLEEELSKTHMEYSLRISKLESELSGLHEENIKVRSSSVASEHTIQHLEQKIKNFKQNLREAEGVISDLTMQLTIERRKVTELETVSHLPDSNKSGEVAKLIDRLNFLKEDPSPWSKPKEEGKHSKSDDSGCADLNRSSEPEEDKIVEILNQDMMKRISELQSQLDGLRIKATQENKRNECDAEKDIDASTAIKDLGENSDDTAKKHREEIVEQNSSKYRKDEKQNSIKSQTKLDLLEKDARNRYQIPGPIPPVPIHDKYEKQQIKNKGNKKLTNNSKTSEEKDVKISKSKEKYCTDISHSSQEGAVDGKATLVKETKNIEIVSSDNDGSKITKTTMKTVDSELELPKHKVFKVVDLRDETCKDDLDESRSNDTCTDKSFNKLSQKIKKNSIVISKTNLNYDFKNDNVNAELKEHEIEEQYEGEQNSGDLDRNETSVGQSAGTSHRPQADKTNVEKLDDVNIEEYEYCASRVAVCRCPEVKRNEAGVFRTCSSLEIHTTTTSDKLRQCTCFRNGNVIQVEEQLVPLTQPRGDFATNDTVVSFRRNSAVENVVEPSVRRDSGTYNVPQKSARRNSATFTEPGTYTIAKSSRAISPANTEHEISSLSDLPQEKDGLPHFPPAEIAGRSPRLARSPGEESSSPTDTYTDSAFAAPTADYGTLSEGELPMLDRNAKDRRLSVGEKATHYDQALDSSNSQMEATLNAISEQLARCRQLLAGSRSQELRLERREERSIRLHAATGTARLPDTRTHTAVFTLHIGTLVFSDEAVLNSRGKTLVLTWKFYDQNVSMMRLRAGRVMIFDFSTVYDVTCSDDFLNYMRQEKMPLTICDINNLDEPFATCFLPLRDVLSHTNRKTDMSLALVWGRAMSSTPICEEEAGVLDLWCVLRTHPVPLAQHGADQRKVLKKL